MDPTSLNRRTDSITCYLTKEQFLFLIYKKKIISMAFLEYFRDDKSKHNDECKTVYWKNVLFILKMFSLGVATSLYYVVRTYLPGRRMWWLLPLPVSLHFSSYRNLRVGKSGSNLTPSNFKVGENFIRMKYEIMTSVRIESDRIEFKNLIISKYR